MNKKIKFVLILGIGLFIFACTQKTEIVHKIVNYDELKLVLNKNDNVLYVVNFWATWCSPCVEELPDFMEVNKEYADKHDFKMILVSMDQAKDFEKKVKSFIEQHNISTDVYLLDDNKRMNVWIPDVDKTWSGAIPATVIYKNGKKLYFNEGQLDKNTLKQIIKQNQ